ncbi:MAG: carboxypeptidase regulatory-like domain-containing protein, partial [Nitrososphaera sp.]|nr:carboxypeptidase regulatory-like domain-containing protein [Nitrososphaera sp.]
MCFFSFCSSYAQTTSTVNTFTGTIKGVVVDSATQTTLSRVTVMVQEVGKRQPIKSTVTSENGFFELTGLLHKPYQLTLSYIGYRTTTVPLPSFTSSPIDLGSIALVALTKQLKEVQVIALKPVLAQDADKLTYNVDADPESKTATGFDILRKIPMLSLDADDNLQLNGSGNIRVLINGKSSSLFLYNLSDAFKNLSASAIKTIEVLTVPPSKYEAQGTGGIINITTYKKSIGGYNGGINVRVSSPQAFSINSSLTVNTGKFGFSGNVGYNNSTNPTNKSFFSRQDKIRHDRLEQTGVSNNDNRSQN